MWLTKSLWLVLICHYMKDSKHSLHDVGKSGALPGEPCIRHTGIIKESWGIRLPHPHFCPSSFMETFSVFPEDIKHACNPDVFPKNTNLWPFNILGDYFWIYIYPQLLHCDVLASWVLLHSQVLLFLDFSGNSQQITVLHHHLSQGGWNLLVPTAFRTLVLGQGDVFRIWLALPSTFSDL